MNAEIASSAPLHPLLRRLQALADASALDASDFDDWQGYLDEMNRLLDAAPSRPPSIGVAVNSAQPPADCQ